MKIKWGRLSACLSLSLSLLGTTELSAKETLILFLENPDLPPSTKPSDTGPTTAPTTKPTTQKTLDEYIRESEKREPLSVRQKRIVEKIEKDQKDFIETMNLFLRVRFNPED